MAIPTFYPDPSKILEQGLTSKKTDDNQRIIFYIKVIIHKIKGMISGPSSSVDEENERQKE